MKLFFLSVFLISFISFPQDSSSAGIPDLHSPMNIKKFGDFLFCERDYLRSIGEYNKFLEVYPDDTLEFKIGLALLRMRKYDDAAEYFMRTKKTSSFYNESESEYYKALMQSGKFDRLREEYKKSSGSEEVLRLNHLSYLYSSDIPVPQEEFLKHFPGYAKEIIKSLYIWKKDPPLKSELTAVLLSAILPGAGKFYIREYGDGIAAFAATVLFGYLSYNNFNAGHKFRGWIFAGISAFFYAGNIYGSAAGVPVYNAKLYFDFYKDLNFYLDEQNYFIKEYDFCK